MSLREDTSPEAPSNGGSTAPSAARPEAVVVAVTGADDFLVELGGLLEGRATIYPVYSTSEALPVLWASSRAQILVIDCREVPDVLDSVELVAQRAPHVAVVLFAPEEAQKALVSALGGRPVLPLPLDRPRTEEVLLAAFQHAATHPPARPAQLAVGRTQARPSPRNRVHAVYWWAGLAGFVVTAGLLWFVHPRVPLHGLAVSFAVSTSSTQAHPGEVHATQAELLQKAALAMREGRYVEPPQDNALLYFRSALAAGPANAASRAEVRDGLARIANVLIARWQRELAEGRLSDAQKTLASLKQVIPGDERLQAFEQQLAARQASQAAAPVVAGNVKAGPQAPGAPSRGKVEAEVARPAKLNTAASVAVASAAPQATVSAREEAVRPAPAMPANPPAALDPPPPAPAAAAPAVASSSAASSTAAASAATDTPAAALPRKVHDSQPVFPAIALEHNVGGAVSVRFTIDTRGEPQDVHAVESSPTQIFDHAAVTAVKKWRYEPRAAPLDVVVVVEFPKPHPQP